MNSYLSHTFPPPLHRRRRFRVKIPANNRGKLQFKLLLLQLPHQLQRLLEFHVREPRVPEQMAVGEVELRRRLVRPRRIRWNRRKQEDLRHRPALQPLVLLLDGRAEPRGTWVRNFSWSCDTSESLKCRCDAESNINLLLRNSRNRDFFVL